MPIDQVENQIQKFLTTDTPEIIAIKGAWGTGKTYYWKKVVAELSVKTDFAKSKYSYVSLFGIDSLDDLRVATLTNRINVSDLSPLKKNEARWKGLAKEHWNEIKKTAPNFEHSVLGSLAQYATLFNKDTLVCIDDLERAGKHLHIKDVLGFASNLKEERNCKVVVIHNLGENDPDYKQYQAHVDKVFDYELAFQPTTAECCERVFGTSKDYSGIAVKAAKLKITNMRILALIKKYFDDVLPQVHKFSDDVLSDVEHLLPLVVFVKYSSNDNAVPSLEKLKQGRNIAPISGGERDKESVLALDFFADYGYSYPTSIGLELIEIVERGYIIDEELEKAIEPIETERLTKAAKDAYFDSWGIYRNHLTDNAKEVITQLTNSYEQNFVSLTASDLNNLVSFLCNLGEVGKADEMIQLYVAHFANSKEAFDMEELEFWGASVSPLLAEEFEKKRPSFEAPLSLEYVINYQIDVGVPKDEHVNFCNRATPNEWRDFFLQSDGSKLRTYIPAAMRVVGRGSSDARESLKKTFRDFAAENKLNAMRMKSLYGLDFSGDEETNNPESQ